ncbi:hypothetical protein LLG95_04025 [bacterium]|nr:hypothetical protein [bacterium]
MEKTLQVLNELKRDGVIKSYAIGGAMAAMFYVEPVATYDLDVFVILPLKGNLISLSSIYDELRGRGYAAQGECILIEGIPVQFLPAYNDLLMEAMDQAQELNSQNTPAFVLKVEYLIAICLQTGRAKDRERVNLFRKDARIDEALLQAILKRHGLETRWLEWTR